MKYLFNKMRLKPYLITVFSIILVLACGISFLGTTGMSSMNRGSTEFLTEYIVLDQAIGICDSQMARAGLEQREMTFTYAEKVSETHARHNESIKLVREQIPLLKNSMTLSTPEYQKMIDDYSKLLDKWVQVDDEVYALIQAGEREVAAYTILEKSTPIMNELTAINKQFSDACYNYMMETAKQGWLRAAFYLVATGVNFFVMVGIGIYMAVSMIRNITRLTTPIEEAFVKLTNGDFNVHIDYQTRNEIGRIAGCVNYTAKAFSDYINAIDTSLAAFAAGDFTKKIPEDIQFYGDFQNIKNSIANLRATMNSTFIQLDDAAGQVSMSASQVADASQATAQGATEQASSVEKLSATITEVSDQISQTAQFSQQANEIGKQAGEVVAQTQEAIAEMVVAIGNIAESSENIKKIIKAIDDIAFQTNILALNAAVEAARAGAAGKGFAVVADEVRNLAQKSAEAAKNTTQLIEDSLQQVAHGEKLAHSTTSAFAEVNKYSTDILGMVDRIANASAQQATAIADISQGVDQISAVIHMNTANSEESAAASQELSGQARLMKELIDGFQVVRTGAPVTAQPKSANEFVLSANTADKY
ncbi:MAG: MCP four helix bundle domain-containing protein [Oscillospiraceae bacterium]|nr:MCP four helix bundle domain-containing protein [Oscillospiraceae bacterium]